MPMLNYAAIVIAAVVGVGLGAAWYSPGFLGAQYERLSGRRRVFAGRPIFFEFLVTLLLSYVLAQFIVILSAYTFLSSVVLALWLWLGFQIPVLLSRVWFEGEAGRVFWIDAGYRLAELVLMAVILGLWS